MSQTVRWSCKCGDVQILIQTGEGTRAVCYCASCQTFPKLLGHPGLLDGSGGTELYQTLPDRLTVTCGAEHFGRIKLTDKGPLRWVATCCNTPMANTAPNVQFPFASMLVAGIDNPDALGPVRAQVNTDAATGPVPESELSFGQLVRQIMFRGLKARLRGRHRPTPFFGENGRPRGRRVEITDEMRARADM